MQRIKKIGQQIRTARKQKEMNISQLAEAVGLKSKIYMSDIEMGLRIPPNDEVCQKIAEVLDIEFVSYEEYRAASIEDSIEMFEKNKSKIIAKMNRDFGTNFSEDDDDVILKIFGAKWIGREFALCANSFFRC